MQIHESAEDYLEVILMLQQRLGQVRSIDIANELGYSKPSISVAMKKLRENGYLLMAESGCLTLTEEGLYVAQRIYGRHRFLMQLLMELGVSEDTARADACKMEHDLSEETYRCLQERFSPKSKGEV